jgi:hypothetical protein
MFAFLTNYKIMIPILIALILAVVLYFYFFRKSPGENLTDVKKQQLFIQETLKANMPDPPPTGKVIKDEIHMTISEVEAEGEGVEDEEDDDDNMTRESLYEEILKLNLLKNPVDFIFTAGRFEASKKGQMVKEEAVERVDQTDNASIEGLEGPDLSSLTEDSYPAPTEDFGHIADKINEDMLKLDNLNATLPVEGGIKGIEGIEVKPTVQKKKIIQIKKIKN